MRPDDQIRLRHLTEAATKAIGYCADRQRADLDDDELLRLAVTKLVEIVGDSVAPTMNQRCEHSACRSGHPTDHFTAAAVVSATRRHPTWQVKRTMSPMRA